VGWSTIELKAPNPGEGGRRGEVSGWSTIELKAGEVIDMGEFDLDTDDLL